MERIERALKLVPLDFLQFYASVFSDKFYDVCAINTIVFQEFEGVHVMDTEEIMELALKLAGFKNVVTEIKIRLGKAENPAGKVVVSHDT